MKYFIVTLALFSVASATLSRDELWNDFKLKFNRNYRSFKDDLFRKQIFLNNVDEVEKHNEKYELGLSTYKQGINEYSDWTWEEFQDTVLMKPIPEVEMVKLKYFCTLPLLKDSSCRPSTLLERLI